MLQEMSQHLISLMRKAAEQSTEDAIAPHRALFVVRKTCVCVCV